MKNQGLPDNGPLIAMESVRFGYLEGHPVLHGLSLRVRPGEHVAIVGRTGAGYKRCVKPSTTGKLVEYVSLADRFGRDLSMRATAALIESVMEEIVLAWVPDARR